MLPADPRFMTLDVADGLLRAEPSDSRLAVSADCFEVLDLLENSPILTDTSVRLWRVSQICGWRQQAKRSRQAGLCAVLQKGAHQGTDERLI